MNLQAQIAEIFNQHGNHVYFEGDPKRGGMSLDEAYEAMLKVIDELVSSEVQPCEPECSPERHAYHQGQWDLAQRIKTSVFGRDTDVPAKSPDGHTGTLYEIQGEVIDRFVPVKKHHAGPDPDKYISEKWVKPDTKDQLIAELERLEYVDWEEYSPDGSGINELFDPCISQYVADRIATLTTQASKFEITGFSNSLDIIMPDKKETAE